MEDIFINIHTHTECSKSNELCITYVMDKDAHPKVLPEYCFTSVGLHPWHIKQSSYHSEINKVEKMAHESKVIAIGETGLDKTIEIDFDLQTEVFISQVMIAEKLQKPLIIHCVKAYSEIIEIRKKHDLTIPWIFHGFNSNEQIATSLIQLNSYLSFGNMLFHEKSKAYYYFPNAPLDSIFLETDEAEHPIQQMYQVASTLKKIDEKQLKTQLLTNFIKIFGKIV